MSRNKPAEPVWVANVITVWGGENIFMSKDEAAAYEADRDAYAALRMGLSKIDYYQWLDTQGAPLCRHRTKGGDMCRNLTGGQQLVPNHWKSLHRKLLCKAHTPKAGLKK